MATSLSIIIPAYNAESSIRRCLDSIPIREDIEVIVIDDGSADNTAEVLREYEDRFKVIYLSKNSGVSVARNLGLDEATGDFITFMDADDEYMPGGVEIMLRATELDDNMVQFNHLRDGDRVMRFYVRSNRWTVPDLPPKWVLVWNTIYKRSFIEEHDIRFPEGQQFEEDRIFNLLCFRYSPEMTTVCEYVVNKHNTEGSLCHTKTEDRLLITAQAHLDLLKTEQNKQLQKVIWQCMVDLFSSKAFRREFGGEQ